MLDKGGRGVARLSMLKAGEQLRVPSSNGGRDIVVSVVAKNGGRVLRIALSRSGPSADPHVARLQAAARSRLSAADLAEDMQQDEDLSGQGECVYICVYVYICVCVDD